MAMVSIVAVVFIFVFVVILLFHFVQQNRYNTAMQMESIARSVRLPLSAAVLKADIPQAEAILQQIKPAGIISRADVVLPNQFQALRVSFVPERPIPVMIARIFEIPVQISLPLYSLERPANPQPLAYLVLQADTWRMYKFIISAISTLMTSWLLLSLMLSVAITWRELNQLDSQDILGHQLPLLRLHHDDEIAMLVRSYNRNQQTLLRQHEEMTSQATRFPVTDLPNKPLLMALLEQATTNNQPLALIAVACETLQDVAGVLNEEQREVLLLTLVGKIKAALPQHTILAQVSHYDFAIIAPGVKEPWHAISLAQRLQKEIGEKLPINGILLRPTASFGIAMFYGGLTPEQLYRRAISAAFSARRKGKNQIQFFDPVQMALAQKRLTEESDIITALDSDQFAIWLQPQVDLRSGKLVSAEVLLRQKQPDGSWALPEDLIERIETCGLMVSVGHWILEESCRLLADWQSRNITLPLAVNLSALQLLHHNMMNDVLELLSRYHIKPGTLILELTESRRIDNPDAAVNILRPLRQAGVRIALDDFGMGYASLRHLHHMKSVPVDVLKIDKNFVEGIPEDNSMVSAIIAMAKSMELDVIAEGVENDAQRQWLKDAGVIVAQGYLFGKAVTPPEFETTWLSEPKA